MYSDQFLKHLFKFILDKYSLGLILHTYLKSEQFT